MKKIVIAQSVIIVLLIVAVVVLALNNWHQIAEGKVEEFQLVEGDVDKYDEIKVVITADQVSGALCPTVVWEGTIPKDALMYNVNLNDNDKAYDLLLTVRDDGIGCLPTDYPYGLTLTVFGR